LQEEARKGFVMRLVIIAVLLGFPIAEGTVLYHLSTGPNGHGGWVLAWLVFAAFAGVVLIKQARFSLMSRLTSAFAQGQFSLAAFIDSFRSVLAGLLLIFPGIISDVMAMVLLLFPMREPVLSDGARQTRPQGPQHPGDVIDGEFRRER
jgi:UPF0716 protein FxsA